MLNYQPQSIDTNSKIDKFMMQAFRQMPLWKKAHLINQATKGIQQCNLIGIRNQYPNATSEEIQLYLAIRWLGKEKANLLYKNNQRQIMDALAIELALKIAEIFENLGINYLIGGSVASSILGEPRATLDIDVVADLQLSQVQPLVEIMTGEFYIDDAMLIQAIDSKSSFNIIHLDTMLKVDIFILSQQPLAQIEMQRRQQLIMSENPPRTAWFATSEDIILQKLIWYRLGNQISDRQWRDVLGVMKVQANQLDFNYLQEWAQRLNLLDLLAKALREAGLRD